MSDNDDEPIPSFEDDAQEIAFWKAKARSLRELLDEAHMSLRDFELSSKELEEEMDKELAQSNKQLEEALRRNEKLSQEREEWKGKYQTSLNNRNKELLETTKELSHLRETSDIYKKKLRDMELDNDDLENAERMIRSTLEDVESRYNQQMEKTTLMEQEIIDKLQLEEANQRLKDEVRELSEELNVLREREQQSQFTPSSNKSDDMTLSELSNKPKQKSSRIATAARSPALAPDTSSAPRTNIQTPSKPRASFGPRMSVAPHRALTREIDSPSLATRQSRLASSRSTPLPSRNPPPDPVRASTKMARDLHTRIGTLQTKIGTSLHQSSKIPRPSLNLGASVAEASNTPLRASVAASAAGKTLTSPANGERVSNIPVPSSSLRKSIGRPSVRLSMSQAAGVRDKATSSDENASHHSNIPRSLTPTQSSARARRNTSTWTLDSLQPGKRDKGSRPSSVAGTCHPERLTSPLHFLDTEPQVQHSRPASRISTATRDYVRSTRPRPHSVEVGGAGQRGSQQATDQGLNQSPTDIADQAAAVARTSADANAHEPVFYQSNGQRKAAVSKHRSTSSMSGSFAIASERSSVSAFREERTHRTLIGLSGGTGPPPVAHTGLKKIIAAPTGPVSVSRRSSGTSSANGSRRTTAAGHRE